MLLLSSNSSELSLLFLNLMIAILTSFESIVLHGKAIPFVLLRCLQFIVTSLTNWDTETFGRSKLLDSHIFQNTHPDTFPFISASNLAMT